MSLSTLRCQFSADLAKLIQYANSLPDTKVAVNEVVRTQLQASANAASGAGIVNSLHLQGLAADLLIYVGGVYKPDLESSRVLGDYWKTLGPDHYWGGDFTTRPDADHFSISPDGGKTR